MYSQQFVVRWSDLDANAHMRNTAYMEYALHVRLAFFGEKGFSAAEFSRRHFGPVFFREEINYFKEVHMLEVINVNYLVAGLSEDGTRFIVENHIYNSEGKEAASIRSEGGWLDLERRKLTAPPEEVAQIMRSLDRTANYAEIPSAAKP